MSEGKGREGEGREGKGRVGEGREKEGWSEPDICILIYINILYILCISYHSIA